MKIKFSFILLVLVLAAVGIGFYRGWMVLSSSVEGEEGNKVGVNLTLDPDKAQQDAKAVGEKAKELTNSKVDQTTSDPLKEAGEPNDK